jgi:O-antigen/teichoic acid export membrane protein
MTDSRKTDSIKSISQIGISDIIGSGITAFFWFYLATLLDVEAYGELHYFIAIAGFAYIISMVGTRDVVTVYVSKKIKITPILFLLSLSAGTVTAVVILGFFYRIDVAFLALAFIINDLAMGYILGKKLFNSYAKYIITQKTLTLALGLGFFYIFGVEGIIFALALSYIHFTIFIFRGFREEKINSPLLASRSRFIITNYSLNLFGGFRNHLDKIIIAPILGLTLLGNYALALQIWAVLILFSNIIFRYILTHDASGNPNKKLKLFTFFSSIAIAIFGITILPLIIPEFFPKYTGTVNAIQIMSICVIPATVGQIYTSKLLGAEKSRTLIFARTISASSFLIAMLLLGLTYGITGVAVAFVLSSTLQAAYLAIDDFLKKPKIS